MPAIGSAAAGRSPGAGSLAATTPPGPAGKFAGWGSLSHAAQPLGPMPPGGGLVIAEALSLLEAAEAIWEGYPGAHLFGQDWEVDDFIRYPQGQPHPYPVPNVDNYVYTLTLTLTVTLSVILTRTPTPPLTPTLTPTLPFACTDGMAQDPQELRSDVGGRLRGVQHHHSQLGRGDAGRIRIS